MYYNCVGGLISRIEQAMQAVHVHTTHTHNIDFTASSIAPAAVIDRFDQTTSATATFKGVTVRCFDS